MENKIKQTIEKIAERYNNGNGSDLDLFVIRSLRGSLINQSNKEITLQGRYSAKYRAV